MRKREAFSGNKKMGTVREVSDFDNHRTLELFPHVAGGTHRSARTYPLPVWTELPALEVCKTGQSREEGKRWVAYCDRRIWLIMATGKGIYMAHYAGMKDARRRGLVAYHSDSEGRVWLTSMR